MCTSGGKYRNAAQRISVKHPLVVCSVTLIAVKLKATQLQYLTNKSVQTEAPASLQFLYFFVFV